MRISDWSSDVCSSDLAAAAFEELRVAIGMKLLPVVTPLIEKLASILDYFARLPSGAQTAIVAIAGIGAAIGPVLIGVGKLVAAFGPLFTVLTAQLAPALRSDEGSVGKAGVRKFRFRG